jgi:hypothetical protein
MYRACWFVILACIAACDHKPKFGTAHPRIYIDANRDRLTAALKAQTPEAMRFVALVDRWVGGENVYGFAAWNAALLGQLTGDPKYCTAAIAAIDQQVSAAESAISGGTKPTVAGDDYYSVGDDIGDLALVYDWCSTSITGSQQSRWLAYANQAVTNVWNPMTATWGGKSATWSGWAIDDPDDNYYYAFLRATMLLGLAAHGDAPGIDAWLAEFHDTKLVGELVPAFDHDLVGGGSREGTGYGVAMRGLFQLYDLWAASTTETIATDTPHTRASLLAFIHETLPTLDRVAPVGDQSRDSTASFFDYHRDYVQELVALFPNDPLAPRAQALLAASSVPAMTAEFMFVYDFLHPATQATTLDGLGTAYYASGAGQLYARSGWDTHATWLDFIAGSYTESHAHQDQGSLMIYKDGWLAYDANIDSHSGLRQEIASHGALRVDAGGTTVPQQVGTTAQQLVALHRGTNYLHAAADVVGAYNGSPNVTAMQREIVYLEPDCIVVYDRATTPASTQQVWQLPSPVQPTIAGTQTTVTTTTHALHVERESPTSATASVHSFATDSDFSNGFRLDETIAGGDNRWLHVLWIDSAVSGISTHDASTVTVTLADGTTALIAFTPNAIGATLTLTPPNGAPSTVTLGAGVDPLPE